MSEHSLELKKKYSVSAEVVYDAWLDPESIKEWMCPDEGVTVPTPEVDARVGGKFLFNMLVGGGVELPHSGEYKELERPSRIQFTWSSVNTKNQDSIVTIDIRPLDGNSCELTLNHKLLPSEESRNDHNGGWTRILDTLEKEIQK